MPYSLGPVKPHVRAAAESIGGQFKVSSVLGVGSRSNTSDHPLGLALDFMVYGDRAKGDAIAQYVQQNAGPLSITYLIWYQKIWSVERASEGWRQMEDRGSATANHMDHVHVSFLASARRGAGTPGAVPAGDWNPLNPYGFTDDLIPGGDQVAGLVSVLQWLTKPENLRRVGLVIMGVALILFALIRLAGAESSVKSTVVQTVRKAQK